VVDSRLVKKQHPNLALLLHWAIRGFYFLKVDGGRWNPLGIFRFEAGVTYTVTINAKPYPTTTCADAVTFLYLSN
jgi:hypothetical protein